MDFPEFSQLLHCVGDQPCKEDNSEMDEKEIAQCMPYGLLDTELPLDASSQHMEKRSHTKSRKSGSKSGSNSSSNSGSRYSHHKHVCL